MYPKTSTKAPSASFTAGEQGVMCAGAGRYAALWNARTTDVVFKYEGHAGTVGALAVSPVGSLFLTGSDDQHSRVWAPM